MTLFPRDFFIILLILFTSCSSAQAFSLLEWLGIKTEPNEDIRVNTRQTTDNWAKPANMSQPEISIPPSAEKAEISFTELKTLVAASTEENRKKLLSDSVFFANFIKKLSSDESVLTAARANKLQDDPLVAVLMEKASENALRQVYLQRLIANKITTDFPSDEQINSFYEANKDKFILQERVYLWQIFLPVHESGNTNEEKKIKSQAAVIKKKIDSGTLDFAIAAVEFSSHTESRKNGGYMGAVQTSTLLPEIRESILRLEPGTVSEPLRSSQGYHLVKRGEVLTEEKLSLDRVEQQIKKLLREQAVQQLRAAIVKQAAETYPIDLTEQKIEEWRLKLRTNL